jgi:hypothetical protein
VFWVVNQVLNPLFKRQDGVGVCIKMGIKSQAIFPLIS